MPTQLEKTAAFLKKMAAEGILDSNWGGLGDQSTAGPFKQPAPAPTADEIASRHQEIAGSHDPDQKALAANLQKGLLSGGMDNEGTRRAAGDMMGIKKDAPGMLDNYAAALKRGHTGAVAGTAAAGAAALLAGVLTYNMLKKKKGGKITQMPMRKAAYDPAHDNVDLEGSSPAQPKARDSVKVTKAPSKAAKGVKAGLPAAAAALVGGGGGFALGKGTSDKGTGADLSGGKTWAGKNLGASTGSDVGDAAVGVGAAALGGAALYQLYKKIRGAA